MIAVSLHWIPFFRTAIGITPDGPVEFMKRIGTSEKYQNNNLKSINSISKSLEPTISFYEIKDKSQSNKRECKGASKIRANTVKTLQ